MIWKEKPCTMIEFQSAHPVRGATFFGFRILPAPLFQSTRPVWGATLTARRWPTDGKISIHAPRVGRDCCARMVAAAHSDFNPRAPCGVRRWASRSSDLPRQYFNPRTPCEVRQCAKCSRRLAACISIHAPRAGCDLARQRVVAGAVRISIHAPRAGCDDG